MTCLPNTRLPMQSSPSEHPTAPAKHAHVLRCQVWLGGVGVLVLVATACLHLVTHFDRAVHWLAAALPSELVSHLALWPWPQISEPALREILTRVKSDPGAMAQLLRQATSRSDYGVIRLYMPLAEELGRHGDSYSKAFLVECLMSDGLKTPAGAFDSLLRLNDKSTTPLLLAAYRSRDSMGLIDDHQTMYVGIILCRLGDSKGLAMVQAVCDRRRRAEGNESGTLCASVAARNGCVLRLH